MINQQTINDRSPACPAFPLQALKQSPATSSNRPLRSLSRRKEELLARLDPALREPSFRAFLSMLEHSRAIFYFSGTRPAIMTSDGSVRCVLETYGRSACFIRALSAWDEYKYNRELSRIEAELIKLRMAWARASYFRSDIDPVDFAKAKPLLLWFSSSNLEKLAQAVVSLCRQNQFLVFQACCEVVIKEKGGGWG